VQDIEEVHGDQLPQKLRWLTNFGWPIACVALGHATAQCPVDRLGGIPSSNE
jgi:hypothetical protein